MRRLLIGIAFLGACYSYVPVDPVSIGPGTKVRARLSATTAEQIEPLLGVANARVLSGTIIAATSDTLIVEVPSVLHAEVRSSIQTLHQRVSVPRRGVVELEGRQLNRVKTTVVVAAAAVVIGGYVIKATVIDPGKEGPPGGGGGAELRPRSLPP